MQWFIIFILVMCAISYSGKISKLEKKVKDLDHKLKLKSNQNHNQKGETDMSKLFQNLVGQSCIIQTRDSFFAGSTKLNCTVLDCDEEWLQIQYSNKMNEEKVKIIRIEDIDNVEFDKN